MKSLLASSLLIGWNSARLIISPEYFNLSVIHLSPINMGSSSEMQRIIWSAVAAKELSWISTAQVDVCCWVELKSADLDQPDLSFACASACAPISCHLNPSFLLRKSLGYTPLFSGRILTSSFLFFLFLFVG